MSEDLPVPAPAADTSRMQACLDAVAGVEGSLWDVVNMSGILADIVDGISGMRTDGDLFRIGRADLNQLAFAAHHLSDMAQSACGQFCEAMKVDAG